MCFDVAVHDYWEYRQKSPDAQRIHGNVCHSDPPHRHSVPAGEFAAYFCIFWCFKQLRSVIFFQSKISWMPYCSMVLIFLFIFFFASGPGMIITPDLWFFLNLWIKNVGLTAVYTILPLFLCLSWSNSSSSRWNIYSVIQISCIHHCLYSQLDRSVCAWDALPCLSGKHIWYGIFLTTGQ